MILKKVVNENGKIVYEPIQFEDAVKLSKKELVFTDEDEEERYDDFGDESDEEPKSNKKDINYRLFRGKPIIDLGDQANNKNIQKIMMGLPFLDDEDLKDVEQGLSDNRKTITIKRPVDKARFDDVEPKKKKKLKYSK
jgi:hypothetical protein